MAQNQRDPSKTSPLIEYGVLKTVLEGLPNIQQLNTAARVCKSWNEVARIIKKNRHQIYQASDAQSHQDSTPVKELLAVIKSQPCFCIAFLAHEGSGEVPLPPPELDLSEEQAKCYKGRCTEYSLLHHLREQLPHNCLITGGVASGVVMSDSNSFSTTEVEEGAAYSLLLLPEIPGVHVSSFYLDRQKMKKLNLAITSQPEQINQLLNIKETDDPIRCVVVIGTDPYKESRCIEALFQYFQETTNPDIAIAGGFVEAVIHPDVVDWERDYGFMGLIFSGLDLRASSVVIPPEVTSESDMEKIIIQMKSKHMLSDASMTGKRRSLAFMFACVARGAHVHGRSGVESSLFRKHFPDTPLIGFFGNGEIGVNSSPPAPSDAIPIPNHPSLPKKPRATYLHSYSTAFTILTFPV